MLPEVSAGGLRPGDIYLGRKQWRLRVERIKTEGHRVRVWSVNGFSEEKVEIYPLNEKVELVGVYRGGEYVEY